MRETVSNHRNKTHFKDEMWKTAFALGVLLVLIAGCVHVLKMRARIGIVTGLSWTRAVTLERRVVRSGYTSQAWLPDDAYNVHCSTELRTIHRNHHTRLESYVGCNYDHLVWEDNGALVRRGDNNAPSWPEPLVDDTHRVVLWEQHYTIDIGQYHSTTDNASLIRNLHVGQRVKFKANMLGEVEEIEALSN